MPLEEFNTLCYLPLPILDASRQHYKPFDDVYGQLPPERDRPSLVSTKEADGDEVDKANSKLLSSSRRVRAALTCGGCFKPRCVYAEATLSRKGKDMLCELERSYNLWKYLVPPIFAIPFIHCHQGKPYLS